jgi:large conductance mechanosensitive channel
MPLAAAKAAGPVIAYGNFLTILINFIIVAFCVFLLVQAINRMKRKEPLKPQEPAAPTPELIVLTEIRDLLKENAPVRSSDLKGTLGGPAPRAS